MSHETNDVGYSRESQEGNIDVSTADQNPKCRPRTGAPRIEATSEAGDLAIGASVPAAAAWRALLDRDRRSDGKFVYAVHTTGLYCRPSCPARHPLRRNTALYTSAEHAERDGFRACSRCYPGRDSESLAESCVKIVISYIESHVDERITLDILSRRTGLSANYLQQAFKRIVGLTPREYHISMRTECFKARLRLGESIASACFGAGFGSSRALYEKAGTGIGMSPSTYKRGGGIRIRFAFVECSNALALVAGTQIGLCAVIRGANRRMMFHQLSLEFPKAHFVPEDRPPSNWVAAVAACKSEDPFVSRLSRGTRNRIYRTRVMLAQF